MITMSDAKSSNEWKIVSEPELKEFGPCRVIGMNVISKNQFGEVSALWHGEKGLVHRVNEIQMAKGEAVGVSFGICRCVPGKVDGTFEYIAAISAAAEAPVPEGMMELQLPQGKYIVFTCRNLAEIHEVWNYSRSWFEAHPEHEGYCTSKGCDCAHYPGFELYPANFTANSTLYIYFPVKTK